MKEVSKEVSKEEFQNFIKTFKHTHYERIRFSTPMFYNYYIKNEKVNCYRLIARGYDDETYYIEKE